MRQLLAGLADRHPIVIYTAARVGLFFAVLLPMYLAGMRGFLLLIVAFLGSGALSLVLLDGVRSRFSGRMSGYFQRLNQRIDDAARAEDAEAEDADLDGPAAGGSAGPASSQGSAQQAESEAEPQPGEQQRQ